MLTIRTLTKKDIINEIHPLSVHMLRQKNVLPIGLEGLQYWSNKIAPSYFYILLDIPICD